MINRENITAEQLRDYTKKKKIIIIWYETEHFTIIIIGTKSMENENFNYYLRIYNYINIVTLSLFKN